MRVSEVMLKDVETIEAGERLSAAAERLGPSSLGALPVVENGRLVGLLTDLDIAARSSVMGHDPQDTAVREAMSRNVVTCSQDASLDAGERLLEEHHVHRLVVVDAQHRAVGILSLDDIGSETGGLLSPGEPLEHLSLYS